MHSFQRILQGFQWRRKKGILAICLCLGSSIPPALSGASLTSNGLGTSVLKNGMTFNITGGTQRGGNLFHSFQLFNVGTGETASFDLPGGGGVSNILARVTGGASSIDGTIHSDANLYLINPAGILFNANAKLDINGAFTATTSDYVTLSDGRILHTSDFSNDALLSSAPPQAFGFLKSNRAELNLASGASLSSIGQSVSLIGSSRGGINFSAGSNINAAGGKAVIRGGRLTMDTFSSVGAHEVSVKAAGSMTMKGASILAESKATIQTQRLNMQEGSYVLAASTGAAGMISLQAQQISLSNSQVHATNSAEDNSKGGINVKADHLQIFAGSEISAQATGDSPGGDISVVAKNIAISGAGTDVRTGIITDTGASRGGGNVSVETDKLSVTAGGRISANTAGKGNGGDVHVKARSIYISGKDSDLTTGITADSDPSPRGGPGGAGGNVKVETGSLRIVDQGQIAAGTFGLRKGGNVSVSARDIFIRGDLSGALTGVATDSAFGTTGGPAGDVRVRADNLRIETGGQISSNTFGYGKGGDVFVDAGRIELSGNMGLNFTGLAADSLSSAQSGDGGSLTVHADSLSLDRGASLECLSLGTGRAGDISVEVQDPLLLTNASVISTSAALSTAGLISLNSATDLVLKGGSTITVNAPNGDAGQITLQVTRLLYLLDSNLVAAAGQNGGNILIDPVFVVLNNSLISANAIAGKGGNIGILSDSFFNSASQITATGAQAGTVNISAPNLDLSAGLLALPTSLLDASSRLQETCAVMVKGDFSSFVVIGGGGTPPSPDELLMEVGPDNPKEKRPGTIHSSH